MNPKQMAMAGFAAGCVTGATVILVAQPGGSPPYQVVPETNAVVLQRIESAKERQARMVTGWWDIDAPTPDIPPPAAPKPTGTAMVFTTTTPREEPKRHEEHESEEDRYQRFVAFWTNQTALARQSFVSNAALDQAEATRFDVLMAAMNIRLQQKLDPVIAEIQSGWRPTPEERARMMNEVSSILVGTYDELDRNMPVDWREATVSNEVNLAMFVDPKYAPYMRGMRGWSGPSGGWSRGR